MLRTYRERSKIGMNDIHFVLRLLEVPSVGRVEGIFWKIFELILPFSQESSHHHRAGCC